MHRIKIGIIVAGFLVSFREMGEDVPQRESVALSAFSNNAPVELSTVQVGGRDARVWQTSPENQVLTFRAAEASSLAPSSGTLYLEVTYLDRGYGRLVVTYPDRNGKRIRPDKFTRMVLSDSGKWMTSYERLSSLADSGIPEIQIGLERNKENALAISKAALQSAPFSDSHFQYLLQEAWKRPYDGPTETGIDNTTLKGKIMVGYQGWFRTPNDPYGNGWFHWGDMDRGQFNTDIWPDVSAYPEEALDKAGDVKTLSGKPGYLFSPGWPEVVKTHFTWMRDNKIDGAFVQRFTGDLYAINGRPEWVLGNVRAAANQEGRIWAIEYDVSGCPDAKLFDTLKRDWIWLVDNFGIQKDPSYAHEGGKPVVFIWGMPFSDRNISISTANAVVDFFKNDPTYGGNYVIGGIPNQWRNMDSSWQDHFKKYNGILEWQSQNYAEDAADWQKAGIDYYPHVWPGFSWANLKHLPTGATEQYAPRDGGRFYEGLFSRAIKAKADRLFVGMFDEYDEGTAIMPMSDDPPPTPTRPGTIVKFFPVPGMDEHAVTVNRPQVEQVFDANPPARGVPVENYLTRWEGQIVPPADGQYEIDVDGPAGDAFTLWINEKQVLKIDKLGEGESKTASVAMTAAKPINYRLDYRHQATPGTMRLFWKGPSLDRQEIPASAFADAWGRFLTNEGNPPDWYLKLTAEAKEMLSGERSPSDLSVK